MSTLRVTNIQHPNAEDPAIELSPSGGVLLSGAGDVPSGSTGVPWFLPYPEPGEAFGTQAVEDLADAVAAGLTAAGNAGIGSNVVQTVKTNGFSTSSGSFVTVPGLSATLTPTSATSKIFVSAQLSVNNGSGSTDRVRLMRGTSPILASTATGSAGVTWSGNIANAVGSLTPYNIVFNLLDNVETTSPVTYSFTVTRNNGTLFINEVANKGSSGGSVSSITLIEVAA